MNIALRKTIGPGALLALAFALIVPAVVTAGPGPEYWRNFGQVKTQKEAKEIKPETTVMLVCGACKTGSGKKQGKSRERDDAMAQFAG